MAAIKIQGDIISELAEFQSQMRPGLHVVPALPENGAKDEAEAAKSIRLDQDEMEGLIETIGRAGRSVREARAEAAEQDARVDALLERVRQDLQDARQRVEIAELRATEAREHAEYQVAAAQERVKTAEERARTAEQVAKSANQRAIQAEARADLVEDWLRRVGDTIATEFEAV